jgi:hypothetical protein
MPQIGKQLDGMAWIRKNEGKGIRVVVQQICSWVTVAAVVTHLGIDSCSEEACAFAQPVTPFLVVRLQQWARAETLPERLGLGG